MVDREGRFRRLCEAHTAALAAYALRRVSREDAADVVAETFLVAWRRLDEIGDERSVLPWLYGVARRVVWTQQRAAARQRAIAARVAAREPHLLSEPARSLGEGRLSAALAGLSETDRELLLLVAWEELSSREAARVVGCSATAVRIRLHRARMRLRQALAEPEDPALERPPVPSARTEESPTC